MLDIIVACLISVQFPVNDINAMKAMKAYGDYKGAVGLFHAASDFPV